MKILVDTSYLVALNSPKDRNHTSAKNFAASNPNHSYLIPDVILTEATFLLHRAGGLLASTKFLDRLVITSAVLQAINLIDLKRAREIMLAYAQADLDFVDCCLMALSERLNITQICTYDRRDFSIFRPAHCEYLELLP